MPVQHRAAAFGYPQQPQGYFSGERKFAEEATVANPAILPEEERELVTFDWANNSIEDTSNTVKATSRVEQRSMVTSKEGQTNKNGPHFPVSSNPYQSPSLGNVVSLSAGTLEGPDSVTVGSKC